MTTAHPSKTDDDATLSWELSIGEDRRIRLPITVMDKAQNGMVRFNASGCLCWGPFVEPGGWHPGLREHCWETEEHLVLHEGDPHFWTLLTKVIQYFAPPEQPSPIEAKCITDEAAALWFVRNGIDLPNELDQFRTRLEFQPGPADSIVPPSQPDAVSNLVGGGTGPAPVPTAAPKSDGTRADITDEDKAIALVVKDHGLSVSDIAAKLGVKRQTPYRWEKFMAIFKGLQGLNAGNEPPRGSKDRDGNLEAEDDSE